MTPAFNSKLVEAFPARLKDDTLVAVAALPEAFHQPSQPFHVRVNAELLSIPYRVYHDEPRIDVGGLSVLQRQLISAILTRHHDGYVRQKHLAAIVAINEDWVPPFVIQLVGEYVIEILLDIEANIHNFDTNLYAYFLRRNMDFLDLTEQRVISYWNCYFRSRRRDDYVGFRLLGYLKRWTVFGVQRN